MTVSLHKLTAGDGYTYLTRQVAASDGTNRGYTSLGDYYAAKGESPGQWWGTGLDALGTSGPVTEQQMLNLFGQGIHPDADRIIAEQYAKGATVPTAFAATKLGRSFPVHEGSKEWRTRLGERFGAWNQVHGHPHDYPVPADERMRIRTDVAREMFTELHGRDPLHAGELSGFVAQQSRPESSAVAGFDLTFSPVKSVSTLWAVAPRDLSQRIEAAHDAAVTHTLQFLESEAGYTRVGARGVAQVNIKGLVAARFTHRDSRAGDPDLHTHVAISNKVQTLDGRWLALDARMLYRMTVAASELYNTALEAEVTTRIGGVFTERAAPGGKRPIRELTGVDPRLNTRWSTRRRAIEAVAEDLSARFVADHGRVPTTVESLRLAQQATLATRDRKHEPRSLGEQRTTWRREALEVLGGPKDLDAMVTAATTATMDAAPVDRELLTEVSVATVRVLEQGRARWRENHVLAEATRQTRAAGVKPVKVNAVAAQVTTRLLTGGDLVPVGVDTELAGPDAPAAPAGLRRLDGSSVFRVAKAQLFTTAAVLDAEQRIITAAGRVDGKRVTHGDVELAMLEWSANTGGRTLNTAQRQMITEVATEGRRVHLALAPAGTGKTTVMGVLAKAWQNAGGTVVGLAPQASAAEELKGALTGVPTDTLDKLVHELTERAEPDRPDWVRAINPDTLVIVDEAGLASTRNLDTTIGYVTARGGRVLLVGDDRQRAAAGAGGVLRDIDAAHGCSTLVEVMRFTDPTEGQASLAVRAGDTAAVGFYADHQRLHPVTTDTGIDTLYRAWAADIAAGRDSIMMAPTLDLVSQLNHRARTDRLAAISGETGLSGEVLVMGNGDTVSAGDLIVTKKNNRHLRLGGGTDFVQNNHRFTITAVHSDGSLDAVLLGRGTPVRLPAEYIAAGHVRLGYAHTLASCQGMTVGAPAGKHGPGREGTAHALLTPGMTRNEVYPAMTRGVTANHAYIDTGSGSGGAGGDPHRVITPDAVTPHTINELFADMIGRDGGNRSATTEQRESADPTLLLGQACDAYTHAIVAGAETLIGLEELARIDAEAEQAVPGVTTAPAWETLRGHLAVRAADGHDPVADLRHAAESRELDTAIDLAAVLDYRLDKTGNHSQRPGPLPWLPAIPARLTEQPDWALYLTARGSHVRNFAAQVREQAATWTTETAPKWAVPYLHNRDLVGDLAVWRAAESVDPGDLRPAGPRPRRIAMARRHTRLGERCVQVAGNPTDGADRWTAVLTRLGITDIGGDDYWPVLAGRLTLADTAGLPVPTLLADAVARGPLPTEDRAGALWWRLAPHLGDVTTINITGPAAHRVRPAWTGRLQEVLGVDAAAAVTGDRLWPVLVARVDTAAATGIDPERLITDAAGMLAPALPTLRTHQYATGLLLHVSTLADPEPVHPELDVDVPPDPADQDLLPPPDLDHHQLPVDNGSAYDVPDQMPGLLVEPVDDTTAPADPAALLTAAPDQTVDQAALGRARDAVAAAWAYYQQQATRSWAPQYLTDRGLDPAVAGYAPAGWTKLVDHLRAQGFTRDEVLAAGLARTSNRDGALIDRFSNRVILPIHDTTGTVTAFVGRKHPTDTNPNAPKYVNSPTTDLFHKTDLPYGLTTAAIEKLRGGADLVLVEGPLDAEAITLTATGHGLNLVAVAPLGTALTAEQLTTINAIAPLTDRQVIVALDNDPAGIKASRTALTLLTDMGITNPETITLPAGQDPAQVHADHGPDALAAALTDRRPLVELVVDDITKSWKDRIRSGGWGIEEGFHALQEAVPLIARLPEPERHRQAEHLAAAIHFDPFTVLDTINQLVPYAADLVGPLGLPQPPRLRTQPADVDGATPLADAKTRTALTDAMARLESRVKQLQQPAPEHPDRRPARVNDRRKPRPRHGPDIGL